jgi:hypothetical protein
MLGALRRVQRRNALNALIECGQLFTAAAASFVLALLLAWLAALGLFRLMPRLLPSPAPSSPNPSDSPLKRKPHLVQARRPASRRLLHIISGGRS